MSFAVLTVTVTSEWEDYQTLEDMHSFKGSLVTSDLHSTEQCSCHCLFHTVSALLFPGWDVLGEIKRLLLGGKFTRFST